MGAWMAPLIPTMNMINGLTCQPNVRSLASIWLCFCSLCAMESNGCKHGKVDQNSAMLY